MKKIELRFADFKNWNPAPHPMQHQFDAFRSIPSLYHYKPAEPRKVNFHSIEVQGVDHSDSDYSDAYVDYAEYEDGTPLTNDECDKLEEDRDLIMEKIYNDLC